MTLTLTQKSLSAPVGNVQLGYDGTNLYTAHVLLDDTGSLVPVSSTGLKVQLTNAVPAGSNTIGTVVSINSAGTASSLSSTITTGGTAQSLAATSTTRQTISIFNPDSVNDLWVAPFGTTALANGTGSIRIPANGGGVSFTLPDPVQTAWSIVGAVTGQKFTAWVA